MRVPLRFAACLCRSTVGQGKRTATLLLLLIAPFISQTVAVRSQAKEVEDPFAKLIKRQPQLADHIQIMRATVESTIGGDLTAAARSCDATAEEREKIRRLALPELRAIMVQMANELNQQFGGRRIAAGNKSKSYRQLRRTMIERIITGVYWPDKAAGKPCPEQLSRWKIDQDMREAYQNETHARVIVAAISERLFLDVEQRLAISASMAKEWNDDWLAYVSQLAHNEHLFPQLPFKLFEPHLTQEQRDIWKETKSQRMHRSMFNMLNQSNIFARNQIRRGQPALRNPWFKDEEANDRFVVPPHDIRTTIQFVAEHLEIENSTSANSSASNGADRPSLHELGMLGMSSAVSTLRQAVDDGADVDELATGYITPLHVAAVNSALANVKMLVEKGADPTLRNKNGLTPLDLAREHKHMQVAKFLGQVANGTAKLADPKANLEKPGEPADD